MGLRNWRWKSQDRDQWRAIIKEAKDFHWLLRQYKKKKKKKKIHASSHTYLGTKRISELIS
jgi:hypothetical protein